MVLSLRESLGRVSDPRNLDRSVEEVFHLMLGVSCVRDWATEVLEPDAVSAVVGFGGILSGACIFQASAQTAREIAELMTGAAFTDVDATVKDGVGEICNMVAGAWKGKVPELAQYCGLSVPAVITGKDYKLHLHGPEFQIQHVYRFGDKRFTVLIVCDGLK
jgi:chemotaxis protein CheX